MVETYNKLAAIAPEQAPPLPLLESQPAGAPSSRRRFVLGILGAAVLAASVSVPIWHKVNGVFATVQPAAADLELAALGVRFRESSHDTARQLETVARQAASLSPTARIDWKAALAARSQLTEHDRVQAEFGRGDTVYVDGWLLAHSEIGLALLFAVANASAPHVTTPNTQSPTP